MISGHFCSKMLQNHSHNIYTSTNICLHSIPQVCLEPHRMTIRYKKYFIDISKILAVGNGMFMLLFALATFIRFMIYVKNYHSKFDTPFEKFILASMVATIFLVFATHALRQAFNWPKNYATWWRTCYRY